MVLWLDTASVCLQTVPKPPFQMSMVVVTPLSASSIPCICWLDRQHSKHAASWAVIGPSSMNTTGPAPFFYPKLHNVLQWPSVKHDSTFLFHSPFKAECTGSHLLANAVLPALSQQFRCRLHHVGHQKMADTRNRCCCTCVGATRAYNERELAPHTSTMKPIGRIHCCCTSAEIREERGLP